MRGLVYGMRKASVVLLVVMLLPVLALAQGYGTGIGYGGSGGGGSGAAGPTGPTGPSGPTGPTGPGSTPFNAGSIQTFTNEVAYAGNGVATSFSGYTVAHPLVSIDTTNGGNVTVNWTHGSANSQTVSTTGTFAANTDLSSGSITNAGVLTLTFLASHAPDNGTNITITYTKGAQCNFSGTNVCYFTCASGVNGTHFTIFNPLNLPSGGMITFSEISPTNNCFGGATFDSNFYTTANASNFTIVSAAGTGVPYAPVANCFYVGANGGVVNAIASTDGTKVVLSQCGPQGVVYGANFQLGAGDIFSDVFLHAHLKFQAGGLTCGSVAGCGSGTLGTCTSGNLGTIASVTDSTAISSEGQTLVGNSTTAALALCAGTSGSPGWKAF